MAKKGKKSEYYKHKSSYFRRFFSLFFTCSNVLIIGIICLVKHWSIDFYSVNDALRHVFPGVLILGTFGWLAGLILDNPKKKLVIDYKDLIYEELIKANARISPEELERKLKLVTKNNEGEEGEEGEEENENFAFEDADFNLGESEVEL